MTSKIRLGSSSAPPRPQPSTSFTIRIDGPPVGSLHRSAAGASAAAAAFASPAGRRRPSRAGGLGQHGRVLRRGGRPGNRLQRSHLHRRVDAVQPPIVTPGFSSSFPASHHRPANQRRDRGDHHRRRAGLCAPGAASIHVGTISSSSLYGQRPEGGPSPASSAPGTSPAHSIDLRRRTSLRASPQRHQVLLVTL